MKETMVGKIFVILVFLISSSMSNEEGSTPALSTISTSSPGDKGNETSSTPLANTTTSTTTSSTNSISPATNSTKEVTSTISCEDKLREVETRLRVAESKCECSYVWAFWYGSGCQISTPAASGTACKCNSAKFGWTLTACYAEKVACVNPGSKYCQTPDKSYLSCLQGGGDCWNHYERQTTSDDQGCECSYHQPNGLFHSGGCKIVNKAPDHHACRCHYQGFFTCLGRVELCVNPNSTHCKNPDDSIESCQEGRGVKDEAGMGDCSGYHSKI